ncbi:ABC transporter permease [Metabacillus schmidteae]|uniref:ABC transporter permease n=1 Tax=Metabacillus schmidteae TaxID=2730405 RepID=UPI00158C8351|nr:ABC transporter permease [Metabacillus schmidteae]
MKNVNEIWQTRLHQHINETRSYLKYMLNDHLLFVFIFLAAGGALTYSKWLETLSPDFPAVLIMTVTFAFIMIASSVRTLLKEADIVFLLPMEYKLQEYFQKAFTYSFITQSFFVIVPFIIFIPLYVNATNANGQSLIISLVLLLLVKYWNLRVSWRLGFFTEASAKWGDILIRLAINMCVIFFILSQAFLFVVILFVIMAVYNVYFSNAAKKKALKWEQLITREEQKKQSFYKLANLFTDVPKLKKQAKRRAYLDWVVNRVKYSQDNVYEYLFLRAFIRSGDYFGIVVRLTIIGCVILSFMDNGLIGSLVISLIFTFLTGIQIMSLFKHYELLELPNLYPHAEKKKMSSFLKIIFKVLLIQAVIYSLVTLAISSLMIFVEVLIVTVFFVSLFVYGYMQGRIKKKEKDVV